MKKRILHLIPSLASGGAERQLVNVVGNTSAEEFTHLVCTIGEAGFYAPLIYEKGYEVNELGVDGKRPWLKAAPKFVSVVREYKPHLINTWLYDANITGRIAKVRGNFKTPIVTSLQATDYEPETIQSGNWSPKKVGILRQIDKIMMRLTKPYFVACSNFVRSSFEKRLGIPKERTRMIYNAVDPVALNSTDEDSKQVRRDLDIPENAFVYLNIGRLDPQKNQIRLLEAFARILPRVSDAFLVIVGTGRLEEPLKDLTKSLGIEKNVRLAGRRTDVGACLSAADVFAFPSLFEGLPLALVEAMFKSLPCIAGDIEVLREVITENEDGLLVNPHEIGEISDAMLKYYSEPTLREELGKNALSKAKKSFHSKTTAAEWEDFYRQIIIETN